ncbi:MAG: TIM44-like domain-containing protein [Pseudomonadota bacterium]
MGHHQDSVAAVSNTGAGLSGAGSGTGGAAATALPGATTAPVENAAASGGGFWHSIALFCLWAIVLFLSYKVLRLIFYRPSPVMAQPAPMHTASPSATTAPSPAPAAENGFSGPAPGNIPSDFPKDDFERAVESSFIRLQAANDRGDLDDIREYTTPEIFAEISLQLQERGNVQQHTDVLRIAATLLEVVTEGHFEIASVLMQGTLRENHGAEMDFREVWHIRQDRRSQGAPWLLAGIQQV